MAAGDQAGVSLAEAEGHPGAGVGQDGALHGVRQLLEELMAQRPAGAVAAGLGQHLVERRAGVQVVLDLIDVNHDRVTSLRWDGRP
jgi:hypothetical protein